MSSFSLSSSILLASFSIHACISLANCFQMHGAAVVAFSVAASVTGGWGRGGARSLVGVERKGGESFFVGVEREASGSIFFFLDDSGLHCTGMGAPRFVATPSRAQIQKEREAGCSWTNGEAASIPSRGDGSEIQPTLWTFRSNRSRRQTSGIVKLLIHALARMKRDGDPNPFGIGALIQTKANRPALLPGKLVMNCAGVSFLAAFSSCGTNRPYYS